MVYLILESTYKYTESISMSKKIDKNLIYSLYSDRIPVNKIVTQTGYSKTTILKYLKSAGLWEDRSVKINEQNIVSKYSKEKKSIKTIAREMKISPNTVHKYLYKNDIQIRNNSKTIEDKHIITMYKNGRSIKKISEISGYSTYSISRYLKNNHITINNHIPSQKFDYKKILEFYLKHKNLQKTSNEFKISQQTIKKILHNNGYSRKNFRAKNWDTNNDKKIVRLYNKGKSAQEIGNILGYCHTTILRHLKRIKVQKRKTSSKTYIKIPELLIKSIKRSAKIRDIEFNLSKAYLYRLYTKQNNKCALSGVDIKFSENYNDHLTGGNSASLDRIDSSKGYVKGNVQWVHKKLNIMKQAMNNEEFVNWCRIISEYNS